MRFHCACPLAHRTSRPPKVGAFAAGIGRTAAVAALLALGTARSAHAQYIVTDLGLLPGATFSYAYGINNNGQIVGASGTNSAQTGFLYSNGTLTPLHTDPMDSNWVSVAAGLSINDDGTIAGLGTYKLAGATSNVAFLYTNGKPTRFPTPTPNSASITTPNALNASGSVVGTELLPRGRTHPFLYNGTSSTDIATKFSGYVPSAGGAFGINDGGDVVGAAALPAPNNLIYNGFLYDGNSVTRIGTLNSDLYSAAFGINIHRQVIGVSGGFNVYNATTGHGFLYENGMLIPLGAPGKDNVAVPHAINGNGQIVGASGVDTVTPNGVNSNAFIYTASGQMLDLNTLLPTGSPFTHLYEANGINDNGAIVGTGAVGGKQHAFLLVPIAVQVSTLIINPTTVLGGASATGTVTLSAPAPPDTTILLASTPSTGITIPPTLAIAPGGKSASFPIKTSLVGADAIVQISATVNGATQSAPLTVTAPVLTGLTLSPTSVIGGQPVTGTVTISSSAPTGGLTIALTSANPAVTTIASASIAAGATSATFTFNTGVLPKDATGAITATLNGLSVNASLTVQAPHLVSLTLAPRGVAGGGKVTGTVTLANPVPVGSGGATVALSSDNTAATVPASVTVSESATSATFTITTTSVAANTSANVSAVYNGTTKTAVLKVTAPVLASLRVYPAVVTGGASATGTVTLNSTVATGAGAVTVTLSSTNAAATLPASVSIAEGANSATFTITTVPTASDATGSITATFGTTRSAALTVKAPILSRLSLSAQKVKGGKNVTGTVQLNGIAAADTVVTLASANPAATVPATVTVPAGASSATFTITTASPGAKSATGNISASLGALTRSQKLTVTP